MVGGAAPSSVPSPPEPFDALHHVLPNGSLLHRVHGQVRAANVFNPGRGMPTRFAPLTVGTGEAATVIPTLYAAASTEAAVCEAILHDVPLSGGMVAAAGYEPYAETTLELQRDLRLAKLMGDGLRRLGVTTQQLTATNADVYDRTVAWARAAHVAGFDGLAWMSARDNTSEAYLLFGDRVTDADLLVTASGVGRFALGTAGFAWLSAYCALVKVDLLTA